MNREEGTRKELRILGFEALSNLTGVASLLSLAINLSPILSLGEGQRV